MTTKTAPIRKKTKSSAKPAAPAGIRRVWQLQEAKAKLSELVDRSQSQGAQLITRHDRPVAFVVAADEYERIRPKKTLVDILLECPVRVDLDITRSKEFPRDIEL